MTEFIDIQPDGTNQSISNVDDNTLSLYFKIHEKVNAKNEETGKSYKNNVLVDFNDIKELHNKTIQSIRSLSSSSKNSDGKVRIIISHNKGETDKFNSFESFEKHNTSSPNPTSSIIMVYIFTLYDAETNSFESYKITNEIKSKIAELEQMEDDTPSFISRVFISNMLTTTAKITIEYTDYVKARHFIAMFDEWIRGCDEGKAIEVINTMKSFSHLIPRFGSLVICVLIAIFTINAINLHLIDDKLTVKFIIAYASFFIVIQNIGTMCLRNIEMAIDGYLVMSHLNLNKGDAKLIKDYANKNQKSFIRAIAGVVGTICTGVITKFTYDLIHWLIA